MMFGFSKRKQARLDREEQERLARYEQRRREALILRYFEMAESVDTI